MESGQVVITLDVVREPVRFFNHSGKESAECNVRLASHCGRTRTIIKMIAADAVSLLEGLFKQGARLGVLALEKQGVGLRDISAIDDAGIIYNISANWINRQQSEGNYRE